MRILITRPCDDAARLARRLSAAGHEPVIASLMVVHMHAGGAIALDGVQAIVATSANGVRAFAGRNPERALTLFAVGPQTAETARAVGFTDVVSAEGDAVALAELVAARCTPAKGELFHAAGAETTGRLRQRLEAQRFTVRSEILYEAQAVDRLPPNAVEALTNDSLDAVLVFSPRSARIFADLVAAADLTRHCARLNAYCISAAAAEPLTSLGFARVAVAGIPNEEAMLALIAHPAAGAVAPGGRSHL